MDHLFECRPRDDPPAVAHQTLNNREFLRRERHPHAAPGGRPRREIDRHIPHGDGGRYFPVAAPQNGADAGDQFSNGEGLHEVVIGAQIKRADAVVFRAL